MIAVQVAAGIILAYVLIVNQRAILRAAGWCLSVLIGIGIVIALGWGGSAAIGAATSHWPVIWDKLGTAIGAITGIVLFCAGGYGLIRIVRFVLKTNKPVLNDNDKGSLLVIGGFGFLNAMLVYAVSWPLLSYTVIGTWYDDADQWSRVNGHADGASMLIAGIACLWPLPIVWIISRKAAKATTEMPADRISQPPQVSAYLPSSGAVVGETDPRDYVAIK